MPVLLVDALRCKAQPTGKTRQPADTAPFPRSQSLNVEKEYGLFILRIESVGMRTQFHLPRSGMFDWTLTLMFVPSAMPVKPGGYGAEEDSPPWLAPYAANRCRRRRTARGPGAVAVGDSLGGGGVFVRTEIAEWAKFICDINCIRRWHVWTAHRRHALAGSWQAGVQAIQRNSGAGVRS